MSVARLRVPREIQIGVNLISLLEVNDKEHYFEGNVLTHVFWDAGPLDDSGRTTFWRPWIQIHNVKSIEEVQNEGMTQWEKEELQNKVMTEQDGDTSKPVNVMETRNFVGRFVSPLDLRDFPFDYQELRITIMSNTTSDATFTHKVKRNAQTKKAEPMFYESEDKRKHLVCAIKCNLEGDTLSEWTVLTQEGKDLSTVKAGVSAPAVVRYDFMEHDKMYSAEGAIYQRLDFYVYVKRDLVHMFISIVLPSTLLSASSMCIFAMDPVDSRGDRFAVLFTVLLTVIANQFVIQDRLPYLAYWTWLDYMLLSLQAFVYFVVIETAVVDLSAASLHMSAQEADRLAFWALVAVFAAMVLVLMMTGCCLLSHRNRRLREHEEYSHDSFMREERRLAALRKLPPPPDFEAKENGDYVGGDGEGKVQVQLRF